MSTVEGYLEYRAGYSVPWKAIMMHVGGYHEYRGGVQYVPWEDTIFCYLSTPTVLNTPHGSHDIPHMYNIPHGTQITKDDVPHGTEHLLQYS